MPKRRSSKSSPSSTPRILAVLAVIALLLFAGGELFSWSRADSGRLWWAAHTGLGDRPHLVRIVGKQVHAALDRFGVPRSGIQETVLEPGGSGSGGAAMRWRVELPRESSPTQLNAAISRAVESVGARVLSGRESILDGGGQAVTLRVGLQRRATHEIVLIRPGRVEPKPTRGEPVPLPAEPLARLALVLFGIGEDQALAAQVCGRAEVFSVAVPAVDLHGRAVMKLARKSNREIVLQIPMEPERYPRQNPGPGTLLVNMSPRRIENDARRYLEEADGVVAAANLMGSFATQDETFMTAVYAAVKRANMSFLHIQPAPRSVCRTLAATQGIAYDEPDALLDAEARHNDLRALDRSWDAALEAARTRGHAIVLVRVTAATAKWMDAALAPKRLEGVVLSPLTQVIRRPALH